ncbi:MAG TPA: hypothetical protein VNQ90_13640 [Chthoniobacteraceae bacterium]|nr:hypothetical protein [Chthoniobacteraceae bacterium]
MKPFQTLSPESPLKLPSWARQLRMSSWMINTLTPDRDQWRHKADALAAAGANAVTTFWFGKGYEYRHIVFDSAIYEKTHPEYGFERMLEVLALACTVCHEAGLKLIDHHGFAFVHYQPGHPFYTIPLDQLEYEGESLKDWACVDPRSNGPTFGNYQGYVFCPNQPRFREASAHLVRRLQACGIDGLMLDDIAFMPSYYVCTCAECRARFGERFAAEVPPVEERSFWGNFENPLFRNWLQFRLDSTTGYHAFQSERLARLQPECLYYACNSSTLDTNHSQTLGSAYDGWIQAANVIHRENVNSRINPLSFLDMAVEDKISHAIARPYQAPCLNMMYPHGVADYFHCWAQTKWMGSHFWGSYSHFPFLEKRGGPLTLMEPAGREEEPMERCFLPEKEHSGFFTASDTAASRIVVVFSPSSRNFYGGNDDGFYSQEFAGWCQALLEANLFFNVVLEEHCTAQALATADLLLLPNWACMSQECAETVRSFVKRGGRVVATGATSLYDETGARRSDFALADVLGVSFREEVDGHSPWMEWAGDAPFPEIIARPSGRRVLAQAGEGTMVGARWIREDAANEPVLRSHQELWRHDAAMTTREETGRVIWLGFMPGLSVYRRVVNMRGWRAWSFAERPDGVTQRMMAALVRSQIDTPPVEVEAPAGVLANALVCGDDVVVHLLNQMAMGWRGGEDLPVAELDRVIYPALPEAVHIRFHAAGEGGKVERLDLPGGCLSSVTLEGKTVTLEAGMPLAYTLLRLKGAALRRDARV